MEQKKITGNLDMDNNQIPSKITDAANKQYADAGFQQNLIVWEIVKQI